MIFGSRRKDLLHSSEERTETSKRFVIRTWCQSQNCRGAGKTCLDAKTFKQPFSVFSFLFFHPFRSLSFISFPPRMRQINVATIMIIVFYVRCMINGARKTNCLYRRVEREFVFVFRRTIRCSEAENWIDWVETFMLHFGRSWVGIILILLVSVDRSHSLQIFRQKST